MSDHTANHSVQGSEGTNENPPKLNTFYDIINNLQNSLDEIVHTTKKNDEEMRSRIAAMEKRLKELEK
ncbi:hypothetical protein ACO0QE_003364 [Hanseniaspora vineae]